MTIPKDRIEESVEDIMDAVLPMIRERAISAVGPFKLLVQNVIENLVTDIENAYFPDAQGVEPVQFTTRVGSSVFGYST
jgi:hypothetical protein